MLNSCQLECSCSQTISSSVFWESFQSHNGRKKEVFVIIPYYLRVFRRKKGDHVLLFAVRPSGSSLPAFPPTLLMLESPNLYA